MEDYKSLIAEYQRLPSPPRILIGIPPSQYAQAEPARRAPKRRINPCLICLHLISLVAQLKRWISLSCLLRRHLISLVAQVNPQQPSWDDRFTATIDPRAHSLKVTAQLYRDDANLSTQTTCRHFDRTRDVPFANLYN